MDADQEVFGIAKGTQATNIPLLVLDEDGDFAVMGIATSAVCKITASDPTFTFDEGDATDWQIRVDDTGNSLEIGSSASGVGDNVEIEIDEDGDMHVTGDIYFDTSTGAKAIGIRGVTGWLYVSVVAAS